MDQSTSLRVQMNSAEYAAEQARAAYIASLPVPQQAEFYLEQAQPAMDAAKQEARQLENLSGFVLELLKRETGGASSFAEIEARTHAELQSLTDEQEELEHKIRVERRKFLDQQPSVSPAVGGLYFTQVPDNQVLIALISTLGALLSFLSVGLYMGLFPIPYLQNTAVSERITMIAILWGISALVFYFSLYLFT
jgi:hypothetical protein